MTTPPTYTLNAGQRAAADAFFEFLLDEDQKYFIISGPAGVGKTYLMGYIIDHTMEHYQKTCALIDQEVIYTEVQMTATTNKAAEVLGQSVNRPTSTIHSYLNLRVVEDFKTGKTSLSRTRDWSVLQNKIIFIDECSMIDSDLRDAINDGTLKCKIVFVGDHNQLAPVFEKFSPIYRQRYPFFELTEQMRNRNNIALMDVCQQLRETVETGVFKPIRIAPGSIDWLNSDEMQAKLIETFVPGPNLDSRILAYTNKQVNEYNLYIREQRGLPDYYTEGEVLVNNSAVRIRDKHQISVEQQVTIKNVKDDRIITITPTVQLDCQVLDIETSFGEIIYDVNYPKDRRYLDDAMKYLARLKDWEHYYFIKNNFPDIRPRDAATVHKSQGSTYESVFIDVGNISKVNQNDVAARMLYVAFSRARNHVYLYGDLATRYGGLIE